MSQAGYRILNCVPSNRPLSLNFNSGITNNAIKESVIKGADNFEPSDFATASIAVYAEATS